MKNYTHLLTGFLMAAMLMAGCSQSENRRSDDPLLARVYDQSLYLSDMDGMLPPGIPAEDSSLIIERFVRTWTREAAMLHEAERNIPEDLHIDQLVEAYRASLLKHSYENIVVERLLDSVVTQTELDNFYNKNKDQYLLSAPVIRCNFIKAPLNAPQLKEVEKWWKSDNPTDKQALKTWSRSYANISLLDDSTWYKVVDVGAYMPQGYLTVDNVDDKRKFVKKNKGFIYFFKRLDLIPKNELAPLSYIEDQAKKVILHKRKTELLEELKDKLYDEALRKNQVSIYHQ